MQANSIYSEYPEVVEIKTLENKLVSLRCRKNIQEIETQREGGTIKEYITDEAYMILDPDDVPTIEEVTESFDDWYTYASTWTLARTKTMNELQADIEYIAAISGIDLEV